MVSKIYTASASPAPLTLLTGRVVGIVEGDGRYDVRSSEINLQPGIRSDGRGNVAGIVDDSAVLIAEGRIRDSVDSVLR